ncbi:MAG TPA: transposase, partial [Amycolatopsis sp.]|nr:transposase [Amycolatopsis sp.]
MAAPEGIDPTGWLDEQLAATSPDLLRNMVKTFAEAVMSTEADQCCGAEYGTRSPGRVNSRNGYRTRDWDTRVGTAESAIPKPRSGSYFPTGCSSTRAALDRPRSPCGHQLPAGGVDPEGGEASRAVGVKGLPKSQVPEMAAHLDAQVKAFRERPLDAGPYTFVAMDALTMK